MKIRKHCHVFSIAVVSSCEDGQHILRVLNTRLIISDSCLARNGILGEYPVENVLGMCLGIVEVNPVLSGQSDATGILRNLFPIGLVPHISGGLARLLNFFDTIVPTLTH